MEDTAPAWTKYRVPVFRGLYDSKIETGEDYETRPLASFFDMPPWNKAKAAGPAFVPSLYHDYDAREHASQRQNGSFVTLTGDIDKGDHPLDAVVAVVAEFCGDAARLIYSSPHARPGDRRWRIIAPLAEPQPFDVWYDAQLAFFAFMEARGFAMDYALSRAAQPVFLPNVPLEHAKSGTPLRGEDGKPLYYITETTGTDAPGLAIGAGPVADGIAAIRQRRAEDDRLREKVRREAEARRAAKPRGDGASLMEDFNASNSVETMLEICGYEQSPRHPEDWRSQHQTGETYATRIIGSKWVSLSASDAAAGVGEKCAAGCFGDAYDLYVHYKHGGDHKAAYRALGQERRDANVINFPQPEPPEWMNEAPAYDEPPEWASGDNTIPSIDVEVLKPEEDAPLPGIASPGDWSGSKPPERRFVVPGWIVRGAAGLLSGQEGVGKSLIAQQMSTCAAMGLPFLGLEIEQCNTIYITCEDPLDELWRRQEDINRALGITMADLDGKLLLVSLKGEIGNELGVFSAQGQLAPTMRFRQIRKLVLEFKAGLVFLDNAAHLFTGNENARHEVAVFLGLVERLSIDIDGAVVLLAHPNKQHAQGNKQGNEYSGSTGWSAHVRNRLFLDWATKDASGAIIGDDGRVLRKSKANYGKKGEEVYFRWHEWAFVRDDDLPESVSTQLREIGRANFENGCFIACLRQRISERRPVSEQEASRTFAPKTFLGMPEAQGCTREQLTEAMDRLFRIGAIERGFLWVDKGEGKARHGIRETGKITIKVSADLPLTSEDEEI